MALYTILQKSEIALLLKNFVSLPAGDFDYTGIALGTVNTYYRIVFKDHADAVYFLKIDEVGDLARLQNELLIFENLQAEKHKLSFVFPLPIKTVTGNFYIPFQNKFVLLFGEVKGKTIFENQLSHNHLKQIGQKIAELHSMTLSEKIAKHRFHLGGQQSVFSQIQPQLLKKHPPLVAFIQNKLNDLVAQEPQNEALVLIHADLFAENIHWVDDCLFGILDFEAAGRGAALFDVCVAIHALCYDAGQFDEKRIQHLLAGYESCQKISPQQRNLLPYYLDQTAMRFLLTRLRDFELVEGEVKAEPFKDYQEFVKRFDENKKLRIF